MTTATRKYFVRIPTAFSYKEKPYWQELHLDNTLTSAQYYVDRIFPGLTEAEIGVSGDEGNKTVISKKNKEGKWEVVPAEGPVSEMEASNPYANDQIQYFINGPVSKEEFFAGFRHENAE